MQRPIKKFVLKIHEILGLATGIVVFIVAITGCCWVFKEEIQGLYLKKQEVEARQAPMITPTAAKIAAQAVFPDKHIHGTRYGEPGQAIEVIFYQDEPRFYRSVFLDPYTGDVLHSEDHFSGFFAFVLDGHLRLWLPPAVGSNVVSVSVLLFLLILTTGLVLWWPHGNNRKQRFTFVWRDATRWRRKNFDLHAIAGFYVLSLAFVLAFTGCVMAFDWFGYWVYKSAGGTKAPQFIVPDNIHIAGSLQNSSTRPIDRLIAQLQRDNPRATSFEIHYPASDSSSIYVEVSHQQGVYYSSDYRFFDQSTLEEIETPSIYGRYTDARFADKVMRMNYDIHVGAIGGLLGKIIAFAVSAIAATLPVTGFLLWYGRRYR